MSATSSAQRRRRSIPIAIHGQTKSGKFEYGTHLGELHDLGGTHFEDKRTALGVDLDKALTLQFQKRLAYRSLADAQFLSQREFRQGFATLQRSVYNAAANMRGRLFRQ